MTPLAAVPAPLADIPDRTLTSAEMSALSDAQVADELTTWAGRVAAGEARLLAYIGEFDKRDAWSGVGILSCAHWLSWRLGMGQKTASERVRVARALLVLPLTAEAFAAGRLSFTQVRAITRTATADDEEIYISIARHATGGQLERLARADQTGPQGRRTRKGQGRGEGQRRRVAPERAEAHRRRTSWTAICGSRCGSRRRTVPWCSQRWRRPRPISTAHRRPPQIPRRRKPPNLPRKNPRLRLRPRSVARRRGRRRWNLCRSYLRQRAAAHPKRARRDRARLTVQVDPLSGWVAAS